MSIFSRRTNEHYEYPQLFADDNFDPCRVFPTLKEHNEGDRNDSVIYVHIPFCANNCIFCNYYKTHDLSRCILDPYFESILVEIKNHLNITKCVKAVQFGGGSPTVIPFKYLRRIIELIQKETTARDLYISVEGDVDTLSRQQNRDDLFALGVNRVSFGIQTFNDTVRNILGLKNQANELQSKASKIMEDSRFSTNVDLMYNLPNGSAEHFVKDIELCFELGVDCIDMYHLNISPGTKMHHLVREMGFAREFYSQKEQRQYLDVFLVLAHDKSINFCMSNTISKTSRAPNEVIKMQLGGYDKRNYNQIGVGASARGYICDFAYRNHVTIDQYVASVSRYGHGVYLAKIDEYKAMRRKLVMMPNFTFLDMKDITFPTDLEFVCEQLIQKEVLERNGPILSVRPEYFFFSGNISELFFQKEEIARASVQVIENFNKRVNMYNMDNMNMEE